MIRTAAIGLLRREVRRNAWKRPRRRGAGLAHVRLAAFDSLSVRFSVNGSFMAPVLDTLIGTVSPVRNLIIAAVCSCAPVAALRGFSATTVTAYRPRPVRFPSTAILVSRRRRELGNVTLTAAVVVTRY
jgi:hypothetical protein